MKKSRNILCNCVIVFAVLGNALCMLPATGSSVVVEDIERQIRNLISVQEDAGKYEIASADIRGNLIGPARVELIPFGPDTKTCQFYEIDNDNELDCINRIKGIRYSGKDVILTDRDGETHYITFNNEDDAQKFTENIDYNNN